MAEQTPWLSVRSGAVVQLWAPRRRGAVQWEGDGATVVTATLVRAGERAPARTGAAGEPITLTATNPGDTFCTLQFASSADAPPSRIRLVADGIFPFLLPGPGIVPSHFPIPEPALRLADNGPCTLWCDVPDGYGRLTVQALLRPDGSPVLLNWHMPRSSYRVAEVAVEGALGWWALPLQGCRDGARLTTNEGLPLFLMLPPARFPYATIVVTVTDEQGSIPATRTAARLRRQWCGQRGRLGCNRNVRLVQLQDSRVGKGPVLAALARRWALSPREVLAVGDSLNDLSMLDGRFGFRSATVGNADERIAAAVRGNGGYVARGRLGAGVREILHANGVGDLAPTRHEGVDQAAVV